MRAQKENNKFLRAGKTTSDKKKPRTNTVKSMKKTTIALFIALVSGGMIQATNAQVTGHTSGDIYAGFWQVNDKAEVAKNYVAKVGTRASITGAKQFDTLANLGNDLDTVFGSGWYNNVAETNTVYWGVFGTITSGFSNGNTNPAYLLGVNSSFSSSENIPTLDENQGDSAGRFANFITAFNSVRFDTGNATTAGSLVNGVNMTGVGDSFANAMSVDSGFFLGTYGDFTTGANIVGDGGDMYVWAGKIASDWGDGNAGTFVNRLTVNQSGVVSVIPEPSTYALFGFAALLFLVAYRRANA